MLRKRSRSHQKDQQRGHLMCDSIPEKFSHSDNLGQKQKTNSYFKASSLLVGLSNKASESDSVRSPTSPLDFRVLSNLANPFRSPRSSHEGHQKIWDCSKVGLSIIDSVEEDGKHSEKKILQSSDSKSILFGPQMRIKTQSFHSRVGSFVASKSLPKNYGVFPCAQIKPSNLQMGNSDVLFGMEETTFEPDPFGKILSCSLDSGRSESHLTSLTSQSTDLISGNFGSGNETNPVSSPPRLTGGSQNLGNSSTTTNLNSIPMSTGLARHFIGSLSASEIELSEDYTCVKTYGPNPKTTHIFGDCILECHNSNLTNLSKNEEQEIQLPPTAVQCPGFPSSYPSSDFLSFCYSCKKKLEGEDIYMYRGEKAFCSGSCRSQEILIEEAMEKAVDASPKSFPKWNTCEELSETGMFIA